MQKARHKMTYKIVADSSSDVLSLSTVPFASSPLKIVTAQKEFTDDSTLDVREMAEFLRSYNGKSSTSCPNAHDWLEAFGDAERVFCVTITSQLSGSYNSALTAKKEYETAYPDRKVCVIDSRSTGPEMRLIIEKIEQMISGGAEFDDIERTVAEYIESTELLFVLESMKNLANNGRVNKIVAKMAGLLGIRAIGRASNDGVLEMLGKCRGEKATLDYVIESMKALGYKGGRVYIHHCLNESTANKLATLIRESFENADPQIAESGGLCSFYAEAGGMLIGFTK